MKTYHIDTFISGRCDGHGITKFGGQPDWLTSPQWPVSVPWDKRPLKFIGQIRLNDFYNDLEDLTLAYIFMTQPQDTVTLLWICLYPVLWEGWDNNLDSWHNAGGSTNRYWPEEHNAYHK